MSERKSKWDTPAKDAGAASASSSNDGNAAAAAAAAAAARIAAQFNAHQTSNAASTSQPTKKPEEKTRERDPNDGDFVHDIEINDIRNRYLLTKAQTQNQIHEDTGANLTTKGLWYPDKSLASSSEPPLYLHISAMTKESLDQAIEKINEIIQSEMPQLIEDRQAKRAEYENQKRQQSSQQQPGGRREWIEEKVPINLESLKNFNIRRKIVGPQGMFVKYIQTETGTRVQIKGLGSGFNERNTDREANEPMFINIAGPEPEKVAEAKELALDLLDAVRTEHAKAYQSLMQEWGGSQQQQMYNEPAQGGYGGYNGGYQQYNAAAHGGDYSINRQGWAGQNQQPHPSMGAPPMPEDDVPPPPPPEDTAPPPPAEPIRVKREKTAEELALDKYWQDYIEWERSFKAYHNRLPSTEEGLQTIPNEYR
ncbi:eukaryotic type KH-domain (KH-domain type I) [Meira miltonrushii]|uniref:Eukaryotic type KH-domain (KH-domain type I) n=1 Tax=Meira miltonrushii TaxID=1280837 RepID=A0A316VJJ6_9BASI|nr:eukaryotic type KH-domain (KH-domain type I) [Meira miltonrushii]PWN37779.1 eukaryotic type KH-domain (KH-domain type I) [Meira miltonrushii]